MSSNLFTRDDTIFGVCEAIGEDFGFNPTILRLLFGIGLFWGPVTAIAAYAACGALVAATRWLVPDPGPSGRADRPAAEETANDRAEAEEIALAA